MNTNMLWNSDDQDLWEHQLNRYWSFVKKDDHMAIEKELDTLAALSVKSMDAESWYNFLLHKYFFWKFTAPNRYATTTGHLMNQRNTKGGLEHLYKTKERIFQFDKNNIREGIEITKGPNIKGLGVAGASGLLALLFPSHFATMDQFVIQALQQVQDSPELILVKSMNPSCAISSRNGAILINIMKNKADKLNTLWNTTDWTPRKVDKVLWVAGR